MLALTRKVGERIVIGDNITITIVDMKGDNIRLAIDAPKEVKIYRGELFDAIVAENRQAAAPAQDGVLDVLKDIKIKKP
jgi:carbon storage regulator